MVVEHGEILAPAPADGHDLHVAITRATRRLTVTYRGDPPEMLAGLQQH